MKLDLQDGPAVRIIQRSRGRTGHSRTERLAQFGSTGADGGEQIGELRLWQAGVGSSRRDVFGCAFSEFVVVDRGVDGGCDWFCQLTEFHHI